MLGGDGEGSLFLDEDGDMDRAWEQRWGLQSQISLILLPYLDIGGNRREYHRINYQISNSTVTEKKVSQESQTELLVLLLKRCFKINDQMGCTRA